MIVFIIQVAFLLLISITLGFVCAWLLMRNLVPKKTARMELQRDHLIEVNGTMQTALRHCQSEHETFVFRQRESAQSLYETVARQKTSDAPMLLANTEDEPDDLKKISGIGKKIEGILNSLGIFHYSQIANFSLAEVESVNGHLSFKGRIEREKWIEQAKELSSLQNN